MEPDYSYDVGDTVRGRRSSNTSAVPHHDDTSAWGEVTKFWRLRDEIFVTVNWRDIGLMNYKISDNSIESVDL